MTFSRDITAWVRETRLTGQLVMRKLGLDAIRGVMFRSPVDTGRFRASWRLSIGEPDLTVEPVDTNTNQSFQAAVSNSEIGGFLERLTEIAWGDTLHISNNLIYGPGLEAGASKQNDNQRDGVVGATFEELKNNIDGALRAARARRV